jgi:hypothetical protein
MPQNQGITFKMGLGHSPSIVVDGLVFMIDPNNTNCYSGSGNTIYNLVNPSIGGTFVGYTSNPIDNTENRSLFYNGSTTYQEFYPIEPTRLTVSVWFKATGAPSLNDIYGGILLASNPQYYISFGMGYNWISNTVLIFQTSSGEILSASAPANKYVNAVYSYDGTTAKLYIDGVLASTVAYTTDPSYPGSGNRNLRLGFWGFSGYERYFNGNIGQASLYNRALSATEILQNYNATKKKYSPDENIVTNGLILHIDPSKNTSYPGTGNTIYDLSGFGNTGTLTNGPTFSALNGGSISYDGTNDSIVFSRNNILSGTQNFTIEAFIYPIATSPEHIYGNYNTGNGSGLELYLQSEKVYLWYGNTFTASISNIQKYKWYHICATRSGNTVSIYINGSLDTTGANSSSIGTNSPYTIGNGYDYNTEAFLGNISQVKVYNRTLTPIEIQQNYNATKNRFVNALPAVRNGLVLELDAGQRSSYSGTGNTWYDLSGNSLNGTLTNGPTFLGIGTTSSIVFDGTNDYVDCGYNSTINSSSQFTIECWYKSSNISVEGILFSTNTYGSTPANGYHMEIYQSKLLFQVFPSTSSVQSSITLSNNVWYHLVSTYSSGTINLYVNTVSGGSGTYTFNSSTGNLLLGRYPQGQFSLNGQMSSIRFYNRVLSAYEIKQNFDFYRTRYNI